MTARSSQGFASQVEQFEGNPKFTDGVVFQDAYTSGANTLVQFEGDRSGFLNIKSKTGTITCSGATSSASNVIPDGALVFGVILYVTTLITGASAFICGDGSDTDKWGTAIGLTVGTATTGADFTSSANPITYTSATSIVLTATTTAFTAGVVRYTVFYADFGAMTS